MRPITVSVSDASSGPVYSDWVRFDDFAPAQVSIQATVIGTVNYTIQTTLDDPNSASNPVPVANMTWLPSLDTNVVAAIASKSSYFAYAPVFARVALNTGNGSVTATFLQSSNGPI